MTLRDQTRRILTLLLFFLFGPILTFGLVAGIGLRKISWNARLYEQAVAATGLRLHIDSVEYRTPNRVRLRNVDILDDSTEKPLFQAPEIEWAFVPSEKLGDFFPGLVSRQKGDRNERPSLESFVSFFSNMFGFRPNVPGFHQLTILESEIRFETLTPEESARKTQELLFELLSRYRKIEASPIQITLEQVDLRLRNGSKLPDSVRLVQGTLYRVAESLRSDWTFKIPDVSEMETQRFAIADRSSAKGSEIVFRFTSGSFEEKDPLKVKVIPCELAGAFCSFFHYFSKDSKFSGEISARYRTAALGNPWTFHLASLALRNLDLAPYAAEYTPFPVSGNGDVQIHRATFGSGTFSAEGWLSVRNGSMDRVLFHRLIDGFALTVEPPGVLESLSSPMVPFDQSVVTFRLEKDGAAFWNDNPGGTPNLFMVKSSPLPMTVKLPGTKTPCSYPAILAALVPDTAPIVPLTPGTQKIISVLPTGQPTTAAPLPMTANPR